MLVIVLNPVILRQRLCFTTTSRLTGKSSKIKSSRGEGVEKDGGVDFCHDLQSSESLRSAFCLYPFPLNCALAKASCRCGGTGPLLKQRQARLRVEGQPGLHAYKAFSQKQSTTVYLLWDSFFPSSTMPWTVFFQLSLPFIFVYNVAVACLANSGHNSGFLPTWR